MKLFITATSMIALALLTSAPATAGPLRDKLAERAAPLYDTHGLDDEDSASGKIALPAGTEVKRDVAYGADASQRMDVYQPQAAKDAPILVMVHGGGWRTGDKASAGVVGNKAMRWLPRGFVFVSVNNRLLPKAGPLEQAKDVAKALSTVQAQAASWGADPTRIILMGHSAGAHLVALLASSPAIVSGQGAKPWLGTIALDSAALDVVTIMESAHLRLYDNAFGSKPEYWRASSPLHRLAGKPAPMLLVCSSERKGSCPAAQRFAEKGVSLEGKVIVLPVALSHKQINSDLGTAGAYTESVESFIRSLGIGGI
jgi:acetyl esterase/lipase